MSINSVQEIKCPTCGQLHQFTTWDSITADDSPDLKKDLLIRKINVFECDMCNTKALMPNPILYIDHEKKLMITFSPCNDDSEKQAMLDSIKNISKKSGELADIKEYNLRFVTNYNDLIEKILIFDLSFNDKVTELLKLMIFAQEPEKSKTMSAMFGKINDNALEFIIYDKKDGKAYTSSVPIDTYNVIKNQIIQSGVKMYSFDWEMVDQSYAMSLLRGINNNL